MKRKEKKSNKSKLKVKRMSSNKRPNINIIASIASAIVLFFTLIICVLLLFLERFTVNWPREIWGIIFILCCGSFAISFIILFNYFDKKIRSKAGN